MKNPPCPAGQFVYMWEGVLSEPIECHLGYYPAEGGGNDPYFPSGITLATAWLRGVDLYELFDSRMIDRVEGLALAQKEE